MRLYIPPDKPAGEEDDDDADGEAGETGAERFQREVIDDLV